MNSKNQPLEENNTYAMSVVYAANVRSKHAAAAREYDTSPRVTLESL